MFTFVHPALLSGVLYQIQTVVDEILSVFRHSDVNLSVLLTDHYGQAEVSTTDLEWIGKQHP